MKTIEEVIASAGSPDDHVSIFVQAAEGTDNQDWDDLMNAHPEVADQDMGPDDIMGLPEVLIWGHRKDVVPFLFDYAKDSGDDTWWIEAAGRLEVMRPV